MMFWNLTESFAAGCCKLDVDSVHVTLFPFLFVVFCCSGDFALSDML